MVPKSTGDVACILVMLLASLSYGAEVNVQVSPRRVYLGKSFVVAVSVNNSKSEEPPELPELPGAEVRYEGASSNSRIINFGPMEVTRVHRFRVTPQATGAFRVPPLKLRVDGEIFSFDAVEVTVLPSDTGDLLFVEVSSPRERYYVGEEVSATLEIWLLPYQERQLKLNLGEDDMWNQIDLRSSSWGEFLDPLREMNGRRERPEGAERRRDLGNGVQKKYYVYSITHKFWAERAGSLDVGNVRVVVDYPQSLERSRDPFSFMGGPTFSVSDSRPVTATVESTPVHILPLPTDGRPLDFRGAVGDYELSVTAKPAEVRVGDPITLNLTLRGRGPLETLPPPPLIDIPELAADFTMPQEPLAGAVEGNVKRFTQTLRAKNETVKAIPPIPFSFFDPEAGVYRTVHSTPIPLTVTTSERLSSTSIVESNGRAAPAMTQLTELQGGLIANYVNMDEVLSQQAFEPGMTTAILLTAPPFILALFWLVGRRRERLQTDAAFLRRRAAMKNALRTLNHGRKGSPEIAAAALTGYVADRLNLPGGALTRQEAVSNIRQRGARSETVKALDDVLQRIEDLQYGGRAGEADPDLAEMARRCLALLERERL